MNTYFSVTIRSSVHTISDRMPRIDRFARRAVVLGVRDGFFERIQRRGADIAVDDADATDEQRPEFAVGFGYVRCR